jgi:hypothetical protein
MKPGRDNASAYSEGDGMAKLAYCKRCKATYPPSFCTIASG